MRDRWRKVCERMAGVRGGVAEAGVPGGIHGALFEELARLYDMPPRAYHSMVHVADCLEMLDSCASLAERVDVVEWSLWLHDCVYEPTRKDNEARSAEASTKMLESLGVGRDPAAEIEAIILATRHTGEALRGDTALAADIDMSILGREPDVYERYERAIRTEYGFVPDADYRAGRGAFLQSLLARGTIYHTQEFRGRFESTARRNIRREIDSLGERGPKV